VARINQPKKIVALLPIILIAACGFLVCANSLNGAFIWDDEGLIKDNIYIKSFSHLPAVFSRNIEAGIEGNSAFYRPLSIFSFMVDYSLWKLNPLGYHFVNTLLHVLVGLCLYWLVNVLFKDRLSSFLTAIIFLLHPVHTETVFYISDRPDLLAVFFMLLCFIFYLKHLEQRKVRTYIFTVLTTVFALLSKESGVLIPLILLLYHFSFKKKLKYGAYFSVAGITFLYVLLKITLLKSSLTQGEWIFSIFSRVPGFFVAITSYFRLLLLPFNLHMEYGQKIFPWIHPKAILGMVISVGLLTYAFKKRKEKKLVFFSILWFFLALLPVSNIYPLAFYMAEHWLYLPSIGVFLILGRVISRLYRIDKYRKGVVAVTACLLVFYAVLTVKQADYWKEPIAFYKRTLKYAPNSARVYNNLGLAYKEKGENENAIAAYSKAIDLDSKDVYAYNNLGVIYADMGKKWEAENLYERAVELEPQFVEAYNNLGALYKDNGREKEALRLLKRAIEINPEFEGAYVNLGIMLRKMGRYGEAIALYKKAIGINPVYAKAYYNLGFAYNEIGKEKEAITAFEKAIEINPDFIDAYNNLSVAYNNVGDKDGAINTLKRAIEIDPSDGVLYSNLSVAYFQSEKYDLAVKYYDEGQKLGSVNLALGKALIPYGVIPADAGIQD
jgi:tetratricopeptide (TPR) repeat protein